MKYLFLLYADETHMPAPGSPEMNQELEGYNAFYEEVSTAGVLQAGDPVQGSATSTTVRVRSGSTEAVKGPFAPEGNQVVGFYVLDCASADDAVKYAAKIPAAHHGAVEVRPILSLG